MFEPPADLSQFADTLRRSIVEQSHAAGMGHIGSALSIADIVATLWGGVLRDPGSENPDRDRFVLAKGHAAMALYAAMRHTDRLSEDEFATYCHDGSKLGVHPEHCLDGIDVSTGSLGQGLSVGCGLAHGLQLKGSDARVYVLLSDAECNEGQVWEAVMFAAQQKLTNLTAVIDLNGLQALGYTQDVLDLSPMAARWSSFGWSTHVVDGHDCDALLTSFSECRSATQPQVVIAKTELGHGVSFMQNKLEWHYRNLSDELLEQALSELQAA